MKKIHISPWFCFFAAFLLFLVPLRWLMASWLAAGVHELCHAAAITLCGSRIWEMKIGIYGAKLETEPMSPGMELICALAGPAGSFLMVLFMNLYPEAALCGILHGMFNLLPLYPLDGGRALRCLFNLICPGASGERAFLIFQKILLVIISAGVCVIAAFLKSFLVLVSSALLFLLGLAKRKIPCKPDRYAVQ